nr:MAG TPA: hypothetical protein [Inoviridae sp.]
MEGTSINPTVRCLRPFSMTTGVFRLTGEVLEARALLLMQGPFFRVINRK